MAKQGSFLRLTITIVIILMVVTYAIFNSRFLLSGPSITIYDIKDGQVFDSNIVDIRGISEHISNITLNGRKIFVDKNNEFKERLLLTSKINPIEIYAEDKFGRNVIQKITLVYTGPQTNIENITKATTTDEEIDEEETEIATSSEE